MLRCKHILQAYVSGVLVVFRGMLQLFRIHVAKVDRDVAKVDRGVAHVVMVVHICCKAFVPNVSSIF